MYCDVEDSVAVVVVCVDGCPVAAGRRVVVRADIKTVANFTQHKQQSRNFVGLTSISTERAM